MQPGNTDSAPAVAAQPDSTLSNATDSSIPYSQIQTEDAVVGGLDLSRQVLTREAGVAGLARVLESDLRPHSELEAMLGDQLAAAHNAALRLLQAASTRPSPETAMKLTVTACRVMHTFQDGLMVMHRLRHGDQRVVVQQVRLSDNAQAIVAGELNQHATE
jgi:hypothetical protein